MGSLRVTREKRTEVVILFKRNKSGIMRGTSSYIKRVPGVECGTPRVRELSQAVQFQQHMSLSCNPYFLQISSNLKIKPCPQKCVQVEARHCRSRCDNWSHIYDSGHIEYLLLSNPGMLMSALCFLRPVDHMCV